MDWNTATKLQGNADYWARRYPRTTAKNPQVYQEKEKGQKQSVIKLPPRPRKQPEQTINEMLRQNEFYRIATGVIDYQLGAKINLDDVVYCVAWETGLSVKTVCGGRRIISHVIARAAVTVLGRASGFSFPKIAEALGGRHHTSILHLARSYGRKPEVLTIVKNVAELLGMELKDEKV